MNCSRMSLLCVQEVAELKEEDLSSDTATNTVIPSPHTGNSSDAISPHTTTTSGPVVSVSSTVHVATCIPSLLSTAAAGVSGDLSRTLGEISPVYTYLTRIS